MSSPSPTHPLILRCELSSTMNIPYSAQVSPRVVKTIFGDYVQSFRIGGASFESADDIELNTWHERLNVLWRNIASPQVALWSHLIRRRERPPMVHAAPANFPDQLHASYLTQLSRESLMVNELYLSLVYRPIAGAPTNALGKLLGRTQLNNYELALHDALDACDKLAQTVQASLARYEPEPLQLEVRRGRMYSRFLEFIGELINGESQPIPAPRIPLNQALATSRLSFGTEAVEYRTPTATKVGAMLGIKEYPTPTIVGLFNRLLSAPFSCVLTQSFTFLTKGASQGLLQRQINRMENAGDFAVSQKESLSDALDALTSNEFVMGDHHFSLQVIAGGDDTEESDATAQGHSGETRQTARSGQGSHSVAPLPPRDRLRELNASLALARTILADTGMTVAREDLALEAAFWAQLPGNFALRPRKAPITSRNFAALVPFHNFPVGRRTGNHWGEALALFVTSAHSPFYFSLHASDPSDAGGSAGTGRRDTGHTLICGPTGSGKTVVIGFLLSMLVRQDVTQVVFDKDRGLEILVRAMNGEYFPLKNGRPTGFNPLQLPSTPENREFLKAWIRSLARSGLDPHLSVKQELDLDQALRGTLALDLSARRLSRLIEFLDPTDPEGLHARLSRWCESTHGDYAWCFDHAEDTVVPRLARGAGRGSAPLFGFDVTEFLDHAVTREPVTLYLFHLVRQLLDGRRLVCWMDEFWRLLADPAFERFAKDGPKTWRKLNGVLALSTQSPSDVLQSSISRTLIEQTPTKIFFPNIEANRADYIDGFGVTEREFLLIKEELDPASRSFLVKQGHHSVVCKLDLKGFPFELAVISGRASSIELLTRLTEASGPAPEAWLPGFKARVLEGDLS